MALDARVSSDRQDVGLSVAAQPRALRDYADKSGKFSYYVCQSVTKRGSGACNASRLNARRFEELVVGKIRGNVLTESNIRASVHPSAPRRTGRNRTVSPTRQNPGRSKGRKGRRKGSGDGRWWCVPPRRRRVRP